MPRRPFGPGRAGQRARRKTYRPDLELMEDRLLLAVVTNTNDSGMGSLRQAIIDTNADPSDNSITFFINGSGVQTISLLSPLPAITEPVILNATSQPGYAGTPLIEIDGSQIDRTMFPSANGLTIQTGTSSAGSGSTIQGLAIGGFSGSGILLQGGGGNTIQQNFIGTSPDGAAIRPNLGNGITVTGSANNVIGGTTTTHNLISGNTGAGIAIMGATASQNSVQGNLIGTDINGSAALPNGDGVVINDAPNNMIGGITTTARNIISGNTHTGVMISDAGATGNQVQGNYIGPNATGSAALANNIGVLITNGAANNAVGGSNINARNVISGNTTTNITIDGASNNIVLSNLIGTTTDGTGALAANSAITAGVLITNGSSSNVIGGPSQTLGNVISGNMGDGVRIVGRTGSTGPFSSGNLIQSNNIGVNSVGNAAVPNGGNGVAILGGATGNTVGGLPPSGGGPAVVRNVIAGNLGHGVFVQGSGTIGNMIQGNFIGTPLTGNTDLHNGGDGVRIDSASSNQVGGTTSGAGNTIAFNGGAGVNVLGLTATGNAIRQNSLFNNRDIGIDLGGDGPTLNHVGFQPGPNNFQNTPALRTVATIGSTTTITGSLLSLPNTTYNIDFYSNPASDGSGGGTARSYIGTSTITTDINGLASFTFTPSGAVAAGATVTATATDSSGNTSEISPPVTNVIPSVNLVLVQTANPSPVAASGLLTYTVFVTNAGSNPASGVVVTDTLPPGAMFVSSSAPTISFSPSSNVLTANLGTLAAGQMTALTINVVVPATPGMITNTASVAANEPDTDTSNNMQSLMTTVAPGADLEVTGLIAPSAGILGSPLTFIFTVSNNGVGSNPATATGVRLTGMLPASGATFQSIAVSQGTASQSGGTFSVDLGSLAPGASAKVFVTVAPSTTGTLTSTASVQADQPDPNPTNNSFADAVVVIPPPPPVGPHITSLSRSGVHHQRTNLVLTFDAALNPTTAQNPAAYQLARSVPGRSPGARGPRLRLRSVTYSPAMNTVTLIPLRPLGVSPSYTLLVSGTGPTALFGVNGLALNSPGPNQPGSNFEATFRGLGNGPFGPNGFAGFDGSTGTALAVDAAIASGGRLGTPHRRAHPSRLRGG
ncbi:MAG: DUF11 domain-containing protein [Isosphaeraceae bacterium]|nr:DUF11 domain-containing protein [Isosphaeraceae bacterium]